MCMTQSYVNLGKLLVVDLKYHRHEQNNQICRKKVNHRDK